MDAYLRCPRFQTESFTLRLVNDADSEDLFECYNDKKAVSLMNDDNCDFGFYVESKEKMAETISYWIDFYKKKCFIRFSIVDNKSQKAVGTVEGFGGDTGVLRIDISSEYEKEDFLCELLTFARENFNAIFGNKDIVTKAIPEASERVLALKKEGWNYISSFKNFTEYYQVECIK